MNYSSFDRILSLGLICLWAELGTEPWALHTLGKSSLWSLQALVIVSLEPSATRLSSALITQSLPTFAGEGMVSLWKTAGESSDRSRVAGGWGWDDSPR